MANAITPADQQATAISTFVGNILPPERSADLFRGLPAHIKPQVFQRNLHNAVMANPNLMRYDPALVFREVAKAAGLGLLLDPQLGEGYLIEGYNYKTKNVEPQLRIGYKGMTKLARQSGEVEQVYAHEVYERDYIECELGDTKKLVHRPVLFSDRGEVIGYYAVVKYKNGETDFEPMSVDQVHAIRDRSDAWKAFTDGKIRSTPWSTDDMEMSKKTVIRRLIKRVPQSPELQTALQIEDRGEDAGEYRAAPARQSLPPSAPKLAQVADQRNGGGFTEVDPQTGDPVNQAQTAAPAADAKKQAPSPKAPAETKPAAAKPAATKAKQAGVDPEPILASIKAVFDKCTDRGDLEEKLGAECLPLYNQLSEADKARAIVLYEQAVARVEDNAAASEDPPAADQTQGGAEDGGDAINSGELGSVDEVASGEDETAGEEAGADAAADEPLPVDVKTPAADTAGPSKDPEAMNAEEAEAYMREFIAQTDDAKTLKNWFLTGSPLRDILEKPVREKIRLLYKAKMDVLVPPSGP